MALDLINRFAKVKFNEGTENDFKPPVEFVLRLANDLEFLKDFVQHTAFEIDGLEAHDADEEIDLNAAQGTVNQYWKDFVGGWKGEQEHFNEYWKDCGRKKEEEHSPIASELITQVRLARLFCHLSAE
jgi:hypothetical protein